MTQTKNNGSSTKPDDTATVPSQQAGSTSSDAQNDSCRGNDAIHAGLSSSVVPELRKLAEYEQLCHGAVASKLSFFVSTPVNAQQAQASATEVARTLKAFGQAGIAPLVFMEPTDPYGNKLDLSIYASGSYDTVLDNYFGLLKSAGINGSQIGEWVLLPEGNLPVWSTTDPTVYSQVITRTANTLKRHFPEGRIVLMLDSKSYQVGETWGQGRYTSLLPYVRGIPKGVVDSFGIQGFPWTSPANQAASTLYNPQVFLRGDFAVEAARWLGLNSIWLNTGTFGQMYAGQPGATVTISLARRQAMLDGIVQVAQQVKSQGFTTSVHLFAQDKSKLGEGTDWSYWHSKTVGADDTSAFTKFSSNAAATGIGVWLYDTASN